MRVNRIQELDRAAEAYPFIADLPRQQLATLLEVAEQREFETHELIFAEGAKSECLFLIASGSVVLEITTNNKTIAVQTLGPGDAMGWSALTEAGKTHFQARATSSVQTIAFEAAKLAAAFQYDPRLGYEIMKRLLGLVTERLDRTRMQLVKMYTHSNSGPG